SEYSGHATDIAAALDVDRYDVIAACSGDGIPYEVFNGLARRANAGEALRRLPVVNIPCGSGNAMSCNLNGTSSPSMGALCVVKGIRTPLDLVSVTHGSERTLSFLSQSFGIIAESDLGTENVRWMGPARFTYGFLMRLLRQTCWPCDLAVKAEISDKQEIRRHYRQMMAQFKEQAARLDDSVVLDGAGSSGGSTTVVADEKMHVDEKRTEDMPASPGADDSSVGLPPLRFGTVNDPLPDGWELLTFENMGNFYAGNMAYMSPGANFFTAAMPNDGLLDLITVRGDCPRKTVLGMMFALGDNSLFDMPDVQMRKISGFRLIPHEKEGFVSVDGERIPFRPFQAEVHPGLGTTLSRTGYSYAAPGPK
ncbi:sphinganine kinase lcb4, partial [Ascosphaera acerosa]